MNKQFLCLSDPPARTLSEARAGGGRWIPFGKDGVVLGVSIELVALLFVLNASPVSADSLWNEKETPRPIVADKKAIAVGDILSIIVQENSVASKDNNTQTSKKTSLDASLATFLYSPAASGMLTKNGQMPAIKFNSTHDFDGGGKINNSEQIVARIAVTVIDVLPNQNLLIEGRRQTSFAGETQEAVLRGVVRPVDIAANNTIFSYNVANATIKFVSKGAISESQRKGWFTKIWEKLTPF